MLSAQTKVKCWFALCRPLLRLSRPLHEPRWMRWNNVLHTAVVVVTIIRVWHQKVPRLPGNVNGPYLSMKASYPSFCNTLIAAAGIFGKCLGSKPSLASTPGLRPPANNRDAPSCPLSEGSCSCLWCSSPYADLNWVLLVLSLAAILAYRSNDRRC